MVLQTRTLGAEPNSEAAHLAVDLHEPEGTVWGEALFVHGFGSRRNGEKARYLGEALSRRGVRLIAPDLQGHGESGGPFAALTIERSMADVRRVMRETGFGSSPRRLLMGSSFGALVAGWLALDEPECCDALLLLAPAFGFVERYLASLPREQAQAWESGVPLRIRTDWVDEELSNAILIEERQRPWEDLAARWSKPALLVHGRRDDSVPWQVSLRFFEACACESVELLLLGDGDHRLTDHKQRIASEAFRLLGLESGRG